MGQNAVLDAVEDGNSGLDGVEDSLLGQKLATKQKNENKLATQIKEHVEHYGKHNLNQNKCEQKKQNASSACNP